MTARLFAKLAVDGGSLLSKKKPATPAATKAGQIGGCGSPICTNQAGILRASRRNGCKNCTIPTEKKKALKFHYPTGKVTMRAAAPTPRINREYPTKDSS